MKTIKQFWSLCRRENIFRAGYIAVVFLLLVIPLCGLRFKKDFRVDNRRAAPFPQLDMSHASRFSSDTECWISDRFYGRSIFISCWNAIVLHLFGEPTHEQIIVGKDGFLFYASHENGQKKKNSLLKELLIYNDESIRFQEKRLEDRKTECTRPQIPVLFVFIPTKHSLYFNKLPDSLRHEMLRDHKDGIPFFSAVTNRIKQNDPQFADQFFLDVFPEARKYADRIPLIPSVCFHWVPGPYTHLTSFLIAEKWNRVHGDFIYDPRLYEEQYVRSDLAFFTYKWMKTKALISKKDFLPSGMQHDPVPLYRHYPEINGGFEFRNFELYAENPAACKGKILAFGDSFTPTLALDLSRYFSQVICMEYSGMKRISEPLAKQHIQDVARTFEPDYIITVSHNDYAFIHEACTLANRK